jgi:hypothetical protein
MVIAHHFRDENDVAAGGQWVDDYGRSICEWTYAPTSRTIHVTCGPKGMSFPLPPTDDGSPGLMNRLAKLAITAAEKIRGVKYDI